MTVRAALAADLRAEGGLLAGAVRDPVQDVPAGADSGYDLLVEAIREGERVHYGEGFVIDGADPDLALLAGDHLYALGLSRLADRGDVASVAALAAVIARCAQAHAEDRPADAEAAWAAFACAHIAPSGVLPE